MTPKKAINKWVKIWIYYLMNILANHIKKMKKDDKNDVTHF